MNADASKDANVSPAAPPSIAKRFGDALDQKAWAVATDPDGNIVLAGGFEGTIDFGGGPLVASKGHDDVFVAKLDAKGGHLWSLRFGDDGDQTAETVAVDRKGNVLIAGAFDGAIDFGGGSFSSKAPATDAFFAMFDPNGKLRWSRAAGSPTTSEGADGAAFDADGNLLLTGYAEGAIDLGGAVAKPEGERSLFIAKWDGSGKHLWSKRIGDPDEQIGFGIAVDRDGNALVTGRFEGEVDFGGGPLHAGLREVFVAKYDKAGKHVFSKRFGDPSGLGVAEGRAIAADSNGNVLVTGSFSVMLDTGAQKIKGAGDTDLFVLSLDPEGAIRWVKAFGDAAFQEGLGIGVDDKSFVHVAGGFGGRLDLGGAFAVASDSKDAFVAVFDPQGNGVSARAIGGAGDQEFIGLTVTRDGRSIATGGMGGSVDLDRDVRLTSAGRQDVLVVALP